MSKQNCIPIALLPFYLQLLVPNKAAISEIVFTGLITTKMTSEYYKLVETDWPSPSPPAQQYRKFSKEVQTNLQAWIGFICY